MKKVMSTLSMLGALFSSIGDFVNCEIVYLAYSTIIDQYYGQDSLESSNCAFLFGVFYLENVRVFSSLLIITN